MVFGCVGCFFVCFVLEFVDSCIVDWFVECVFLVGIGVYVVVIFVILCECGVVDIFVYFLFGCVEIFVVKYDICFVFVEEYVCIVVYFSLLIICIMVIEFVFGLEYL